VRVEVIVAGTYTATADRDRRRSPIDLRRDVRIVG